MSRTVVMQARVSEQVAATAREDAVVLGLEDASQAIREGLALLHRRATAQSLAQSYDDFYGGEPAPLSTVTAALYGHD